VAFRGEQIGLSGDGVDQFDHVADAGGGFSTTRRRDRWFFWA